MGNSSVSEASRPQPDPQPGKERVLDVVIRDLQERAESGRVKYGTYLETHNGRDPLWDAYQEAVDLVMYLRQALLEREGGEAVTRPQPDWREWFVGIRTGIDNLWRSSGSTIQTRTKNAVLCSARWVAEYNPDKRGDEEWASAVFSLGLPCFGIGDQVVRNFDEWAKAVLSGDIVLRNAHHIGAVGERELINQLRQEYGHLV